MTNPATEPNLSEDPALLALIADARPEQRRAIRSRKPLIVVSAGAGTGKTHTLARRFAWLLASDPTCRVDQILTLTFTQLAAVEMRERIRATLEGWREALGDRLPHLRDAVERIDEAYISTIHSFALRAIRESGLSLDADPGAPLVGEAEEREFWADFAWNLETRNSARMGLNGEWRARADELLGDPSFTDFANRFGASALAGLAREAGELHGSANRRPEALWDFDPEREARARGRVAALLAPEWRGTWELWQEIVLPELAGALEAERRGKAKESAFGAAIGALRDRWRERGRGEEAERDFYAELIGGALNPLPGRSRIKSAIEELIGVKLTEWRSGERREWAALTESLRQEPGYGEEEAAARRMLMRTAALGWASWEGAREGSGALSFSDLIRLAGEAVAADPSYARRFRHIMIDEFQDTDGIQETLASSLRDAWGGEAGHSLFVVGDVKQSIYRFRHADPRLFAAYIRRAEESGAAGEHIPLSCSYRMSGRLMEDVNAVFGSLWAEGVTDGVPCEPLRAPEDASWWDVRNGGPGGGPALEIVLAVEGEPAAPDGAPGEQPEGAPEGRGEKTPVGERRRALARALAEKLKGMIAEGTPVWDKGLPAGADGARFRPMRWGDAAVLVPSRTQYPALEEAFEEAGIPALFGGGRAYFNRGEVRDLVNLLRLLDRPDDACALTGWMESPFSGLPPGTGIGLLSLAGAGRTPRGLFEEGWPEQAAELGALRRRARIAGASAALLLLLRDPRWLAAHRGEARERVLANVRRCADIAREYEAAFGRGLSACADYLGRSMRESADAEEASAADAGEALRVMTAHASKGLEFPVVAVVGMEGSAKRREGRRPSASASDPLGAVAGQLPPPAGSESEEAIPSTTAKWHAFLEAREGLEEKERLLYVAMTRAQERLICCGLASRTTASDGTELLTAKGDETSESWLDWLLRANRVAEDRFPITLIDPAAPLKEQPSQKGSRGPRPLAGSFTQGAAPHAPAPCQFEGPKGEALKPHHDCRRHADSSALDRGLARLSLERLSATAYSLLTWCPFAYRARHRQGRELAWEAAREGGPGGAEMGTLAHWVLSRWDLRAESLARELRPELTGGGLEERLRALPPYLRPAYRSGSVRRTLCEWLAAFAEGEACAELRRAAERGTLRRELAFRVPFEGARLVGSIDVLWQDEAGVHIRDWKITPERSAPEAMYRDQIRFYALACRCAGELGPEEGGRGADAGLLYLRPAGDEPRGEAGAERVEDWDALEESVRWALRTAALGPFPPSCERRPDCPFSERCGGRTPN